MDYLGILNEEQKEAVTTSSQYVRVNAGAGRGKTRVLASRIAYLVDYYGISEKSGRPHQGQDPCDAGGHGRVFLSGRCRHHHRR